MLLLCIVLTQLYTCNLLAGIAEGCCLSHCPFVTPISQILLPRKANGSHLCNHVPWSDFLSQSHVSCLHPAELVFYSCFHRCSCLVHVMAKWRSLASLSGLVVSVHVHQSKRSGVQIPVWTDCVFAIVCKN